MTVSVFGGYCTPPRVVPCIGGTIATRQLPVPGYLSLPRDTNSRGIEVVVLVSVQTDKTLPETRSILLRPALH